jgi:hypothetical protein
MIDGHILESFDIFLCAGHSIGDGIALHMLSNELLCLIGGPLTDEELASSLFSEWQMRCDGVFQFFYYRKFAFANH